MLSANAYTTHSENSYFFVFLAANSTQNLGNVPEARIDGFELEARARPARGLELNAALGYTNSKITEFPDPTVIGNEAPLISRYTLNLGAQYRGADHVGGLGILARRRLSPHRPDLVGAVQHHQPRSDRPGQREARVEGERWSFTAFAENLFDEDI